MLRNVSVQAGTRRSRAHEENEDRASVGADIVFDTGVKRWTLTSSALLAVFDGVGGAPCGALASHLAARAVSAADVPDDEAALADLLLRADRTLLDTAQADLTRTGMATTAATLVVPSGDAPAIIANVGDSVVAQLGPDGLEGLTVSDRVGGYLHQSLGGRDDPDMRPHVRSVDLQANERLLLATDGLTDVVAPEAIAGTLREERDEPVARLLELVELAYRPDDATIMVVDLEEA